MTILAYISNTRDAIEVVIDSHPSSQEVCIVNYAAGAIPIKIVGRGVRGARPIRIVKDVPITLGYIGNTQQKILSIEPANLILYLPLGEASGTLANDLSPKGNNCQYSASGVTYAQGGIASGEVAPSFNGTDTHVNILTATRTFDTDWNGNLFSMITWGRVDSAARWVDASTFRYLMHIRAADSTVYAVMGKNQTDNQLEWRRRTTGVITSHIHTFPSGGPTTWFAMGMTFNQAIPELRFFLWDSVEGFRRVGLSNSVNLADWGNNPPVEGASCLAAGSTTLQEWIGQIAHGAVWAGKCLTDQQMSLAMTP